MPDFERPQLTEPEPEQSGFLQNLDPRLLTGLVAGATCLVLFVGCLAIYTYAQKQLAPTQGATVLNFTSAPTLTPSLTPIPSGTLSPGRTPTLTPTIDLTATITNIPAMRFATLSEITGTVEVKTGESGSWIRIETNTAIRPGTTVLTSENSSVKITLSEGSIVRLSSQTQFTLTELGGATTDPVTKFKLDFGKVWAIVTEALGNGRLEVQMPVGVASVRGSFMSAENNTTDNVEIVTCLEGHCRYENQGGAQDLTTNQQTESQNGAAPGAPHPIDPFQLADWAKQHIPEVATLTPTATPTRTRTPTYTPSMTYTASLTFTPTATYTPTPITLLQNGSFEDGFTNGVANGWTSWTISDANAAPQNNCGRKEPTFQQISSSLDSRRVKDGASAQQMLTPVTDPGFGFYGGLRQVISGLTPGKTYRFTIWASSWSSTGDNPAVSEGTGPVWFQIAIGQGVTHADDPNIKRSDLLNIKDSYTQLSVEAVAVSNTLTVFTYANPSSCSKHNEAFFDAALLAEPGAPTSTPTNSPTPVPPTNTATATPGPAVKLAFIVQPGKATAGAAITPAIQVAIQDASGRTVPYATNTITVTIGTNPGNGTLSGTLTVGPVSGVATFSNVSIDKVGTGYTLTASATGLTGVTSATFNVSPASASALVISGLPTSVATRTPQSITVTAKDAFGNVATGYTGTVKFTSTDTAAVLPSNYTFVSADNGVKSFSVTFNTTGSKSVTATDTVTSSITGSASTTVI